MHGFEASDGVVTTNIDTTIAATRIGSLRLTSDTDVASNQISRMASLETDACKLWRGFKDKKIFAFTLGRASGSALFFLSSRTHSGRASRNGNSASPPPPHHPPIS